MERHMLANRLREMADEIIVTDITPGDVLNRFCGWSLEEIIEQEDNRTRSGVRFERRTRIRLLSNLLQQLIVIYNDSLSVKQLSFANDLVEMIDVGCFGLSEADSDFSEQLRMENYRISEEDSEFSLQVRISNLLQGIMPDGAWIVQ